MNKILSAIKLIINAVMAYMAFDYGVKKQKNKELEGDVESVEKARKARDNVRNNPDYARWLRDKYKR